MAGLEGKWVWAWNWRRCDDGDPARVASRLRGGGCAGALVKAFDGGRWFDQGAPWREIAAALKRSGSLAGAWGYCYGQDPAAEAQRAIETAQYGEADLLVLDAEDEFKGRPEAAEELCSRIRSALGPQYPLFYSSFAIARYHASFPFDVFNRYCSGAVPQAYWNAFRWPLEEAISLTYEDYANLGLKPQRVFPAGGLYQEGFIRYPEPAEVQAFIRQSQARGSPGVSFWSYEHMSEEMWQAVAGAAAREEDAMSSEEFAQVTRSLGELSGRVTTLEAEVQTLKSAPPAPSSRTYTVQPGDSLSGIAAQLGLPGWQPLYDANRPMLQHPDKIYPGQVLIIP